VGPFDRIVTKGMTDIDVAVGSARSVRVEAQPNIAQLIETNASGGTLTISDRKAYTTDKRAVVHVTVPSLTGLALNGSSNAAVNAARGQSLTIDISGAGNVSASGNVGNLMLNSSGVGNADLTKLSARDAVVRVSGVGNANLGDAKSLDVGIYGVGSVTYLGSPHVVHQEIRGIGHLSHA
jgi:hypothetical protein